MRRAITNNNSQPFRINHHQLKKKHRSQRRFSSDSGPESQHCSACLVGLPASFVPTDVRRFVSRLISDSGSLQKVIYVPDRSVPWTLQTNLLRFSTPESVAELVQELGKIRDRRRPGMDADEDGWKQSDDGNLHEDVEIEKIGKQSMGVQYQQALEHQAREVSWLKSQSGLVTIPRPEEQEDEALGHRPGRAVLLAGLPLHSDPLQIENTLVNFGFPVLRAQPLAAYERLLRRLYWPFLDPSPSCLSNRMTKSKKNDSKKKTSRCQVVYTPSLSISNHLVGELNHLVPSWLGSRVPKNSELLGLPSSGWKLKAKVLY